MRNRKTDKLGSDLDPAIGMIVGIGGGLFLWLVVTAIFIFVAA